MNPDPRAVTPGPAAVPHDFTPPDQALGVREVVARAKASRRAGLGELVTFFAMGALGMVSLGVAAAAFQRASATRSGDTATVVIGRLEANRNSGWGLTFAVSATEEHSFIGGISGICRL